MYDYNMDIVNIGDPLIDSLVHVELQANNNEPCIYRCGSYKLLDTASYSLLYVYLNISLFDVFGKADNRHIKEQIKASYRNLLHHCDMIYICVIW